MYIYIYICTHIRNIDDIDLFAGGLSEPSVRGGIVGETFGTSIARQFRRLRSGDRFWYENNVPGTTGFTLGIEAFNFEYKKRIYVTNSDVSITK